MEEFNEEKFKTKINNMFVKLLTGVMKGTLEEVDHFIADNVYNKYNEYINELNAKNERQMYDELNVKDVFVLNRSVLEDKEVVSVRLISRYMDYVIDKSTFNLLRGDNTRRIEKTYSLIFEKKINSKEIKAVRKCPGCGASIDVNSSGKCIYCDTIFNQEDYDYVLTSIEGV